MQTPSYNTEAWELTVDRVIIHTPNYLSFDGKYSVGGRQRHIRDVAETIRDHWGRRVVIVQKARNDFEVQCQYGFDVVGIRSNPTAKGDPSFAKRVRAMAGQRDALLYASGEDAWPFFHKRAKAIQHGVWWDGPQPWLTRTIQRHRAISCVKSVRSTLCVDTNFVNWLRGQGAQGVSLANKCTYIPNYVDLDRLALSADRGGGPLRLICARRYEAKRGIDIFVDALAHLRKRGLWFVAHISAQGGEAQVVSRARSLGLGDCVSVSEDDMETVLQRYRDADIAVVPTVWSEGTSLACIEALCAGVPVVATPVGGLGNLIIPGFNGQIVNPEASSIAHAIEELSAPATLARMRANCLSMREALGINSWRARLIQWLRS